MPAATSDSPDFSQDIAAVGKQYPALAPYLGNVKVQYGSAPEGDPRQLEFYPPWEGENPNPGATTLEIYNRGLQGPAMQSAIAGDMLHLLGGVDPRTQQPIDPRWLALRQQLMAARSPQNEAMDRRTYQEEEGSGGRSYEDWINQNRADAYIRGYLTPDQADEWRKGGVYSPDMIKILDQMRSYLQTPPVHTLFTNPQPASPVLDFLRKGVR